ncbi:MAG: hypothetical protein HRU15_19930 [Planctomycetes bacterium]|nr:hypothetical protein [Planctomycetota bacterium]
MSSLIAGNGGTPLHRLKQQRMNREAYEEFVKDLKDRTQLKTAYSAVEEIVADETRAQQRNGPASKTVFVSAQQTQKINKRNKQQAEEERNIVEPNFKSLAFGAAKMREQAIRIDGDLQDWGKLEHPMQMKYYSDDANTTFAGGIKMYMQWSNEGLYFAYRMPSNHQPVIPGRRAPYAGDVFEVWVDVKNARDVDMKISQTSHQFILCPFGLRDSKGSVTEFGRGSRGLLTGKVYVDVKEEKGRVRAKKDANGYTVEGFISTRALAKPVLTPGMYLAANFSINKQSFSGKHATQWSASKAIETQNKPDTWGDIVLLGTDAQLRFYDIEASENSEDNDTSPEFVSVGDIISIEVTDKDMNIRHDIRDSIALSLSAQHSAQEILLILKETEINSGVFRASCNTQAAFKTAQKNHLGIRQGDTIVARYTDVRAAFGESNRIVEQALPVAWAVFAQNKSKK